MSAALDVALTQLAPRMIVLDGAPQATLSRVIAWVAGRSDVVVTWDRSQPGLLVTADGARAQEQLERGRPVLATAPGASLLTAPDGWAALVLPEGTLVAPAPPSRSPPAAQPQVAIVVPDPRRGRELRRCLDGADAATRPCPAELVLVDDASTDPEVFAVLDELGDWPAVRILRNTTNLGFTATVNRGLRATTGDVVVLNSDTEVGPRWLERLRAAAYRDPQHRQRDGALATTPARSRCR